MTAIKDNQNDFYSLSPLRGSQDITDHYPRLAKPRLGLTLIAAPQLVSAVLAPTARRRGIKHCFCLLRKKDREQVSQIYEFPKLACGLRGTENTPGRFDHAAFLTIDTEWP